MRSEAHRVCNINEQRTMMYIGLGPPAAFLADQRRCGEVEPIFACDTRRDCNLTYNIHFVDTDKDDNASSCQVTARLDKEELNLAFT